MRAAHTLDQYKHPDSTPGDCPGVHAQAARHGQHARLQYRNSYMQRTHSSLKEVRQGADDAAETGLAPSL